MKSFRAGLIVSFVASLLVAPGCVMPDQQSQMEQDVADIQQRLARIEREQTAAERRLEQLANEPKQIESEVTRADLADVVVQVDQVSRQMAMSGERMNDIEQRLDHFSQDLQRARDASHRPVSDTPSIGDPLDEPPPGSEDPGDPGHTRPANAHDVHRAGQVGHITLSSPCARPGGQRPR